MARHGKLPWKIYEHNWSYVGDVAKMISHRFEAEAGLAWGLPQLPALLPQLLAVGGCRWGLGCGCDHPSYQNQSPKLCEKPMLGLREALVISWMCWERKGFRRQCTMSFSSARSLHGEQQLLNLADVLIQKLSPCSSQCLAQVPGKWQPLGFSRCFSISNIQVCFLGRGNQGEPPNQNWSLLLTEPMVLDGGLGCSNPWRDGQVVHNLPFF